jgi:N-acetylglucosaminyldiphosphoundecaprenol N-acetyl-beta-D-mannosaminyltransferase
MNRIEFFGAHLDTCGMAETVNLIDQQVTQNRFIQHGVVNVAKLVNMRSNQSLNDSVNSCDLINIDGMGILWGARLLGFKVSERVAGADLFFELLSLSEKKGYPIYLLGAKADVAEKAYQNIKLRYPNLNIAGYHHGYFWDNEEAMVKKIRESGAKLLFVAITSPLKENFINRWKQALGVHFVMGVGGTLDIAAGVTLRAPQWVQKLGLEWLYRLCQEPKRMWKRYLVTNSQFAWMLLKAKLTCDKTVHRAINHSAPQN